MVPTIGDLRILQATMEAPEGLLQDICAHLRRPAALVIPRARNLIAAGLLLGLDGEPWALTLAGARRLQAYRLHCRRAPGALREQALALLRQGLSHRQVVVALGERVSRQLVTYWAQRAQIDVTPLHVKKRVLAQKALLELGRPCLATRALEGQVSSALIARVWQGMGRSQRRTPGMRMHPQYPRAREMLLQGIPPLRVAREVGAARCTVYAWRIALRERGDMP